MGKGERKVFRWVVMPLIIPPLLYVAWWFAVAVPANLLALIPLSLVLFAILLFAYIAVRGKMPWQNRRDEE